LKAKNGAAWAALALLCACSSPERLPAGDASRVLDWAATQRVPRGSVRDAGLPFGLIASHVVMPVAIARLKDGRYCVLLKTKIGWKDNFEGVLACTGAITRNEIQSYAANGRTYTFVSLPGYGVFEELYIAGKRDDRTYDVYFNLN
jgi:hypothetical protein